MTNGLAISPHCRVIVDNDYQGDPDGLVALAHHLCSPVNRVAAVTSSFLNPRFPWRRHAPKTARPWPVSGVWPLGDSPALLVTALSTESSAATLLPSEEACRARRYVYTDLDFRLIVADMLARFRMHERRFAATANVIL